MHPLKYEINFRVNILDQKIWNISPMLGDVFVIDSVYLEINISLIVFLSYAAKIQESFNAQSY